MIQGMPLGIAQRCLGGIATQNSQLKNPKRVTSKTIWQDSAGLVGGGARAVAKASGAAMRGALGSWARAPVQWPKSLVQVEGVLGSWAEAPAAQWPKSPELV